MSAVASNNAAPTTVTVVETLFPSSTPVPSPSPSFSGAQVSSSNSVGSGPHLGFVVIAVLGFLGLTFLVVGISVPVFRWRSRLRAQGHDNTNFKGKARQIDVEYGQSRGFGSNIGFVGVSRNESRATVSFAATRSTSYQTHSRNNSGPDITSPLLEEMRSNPLNDNQLTAEEMEEHHDSFLSLDQSKINIHLFDKIRNTPQRSKSPDGSGASRLQSLFGLSAATMSSAAMTDQRHVTSVTTGFPRPLRHESLSLEETVAAGPSSHTPSPPAPIATLQESSHTPVPVSTPLSAPIPFSSANPISSAPTSSTSQNRFSSFISSAFHAAGNQNNNHTRSRSRGGLFSPLQRKPPMDPVLEESSNVGSKRSSAIGSAAARSSSIPTGSGSVSAGISAGGTHSARRSTASKGKGKEREKENETVAWWSDPASEAAHLQSLRDGVSSTSQSFPNPHQYSHDQHIHHPHHHQPNAGSSSPTAKTRSTRNADTTLLANVFNGGMDSRPSTTSPPSHAHSHATRDTGGLSRYPSVAAASSVLHGNEDVGEVVRKESFGTLLEKGIKALPLHSQTPETSLPQQLQLQSHTATPKAHLRSPSAKELQVVQTNVTLVQAPEVSPHDIGKLDFALVLPPALHLPSPNSAPSPAPTPPPKGPSQLPAPLALPPFPQPHHYHGHSQPHRRSTATSLNPPMLTPQGIPVSAAGSTFTYLTQGTRSSLSEDFGGTEGPSPRTAISLFPLPPTGNTHPGTRGGLTLLTSAAGPFNSTTNGASEQVQPTQPNPQPSSTRFRGSSINDSALSLPFTLQTERFFGVGAPGAWGGGNGSDVIPDSPNLTFQSPVETLVSMQAQIPEVNVGVHGHAHAHGSGSQGRSASVKTGRTGSGDAASKITRMSMPVSLHSPLAPSPRSNSNSNSDTLASASSPLQTSPLPISPGLSVNSNTANNGHSTGDLNVVSTGSSTSGKKNHNNIKDKKRPSWLPNLALDIEPLQMDMGNWRLSKIGTPLEARMKMPGTPPPLPIVVATGSESKVGTPTTPSGFGFVSSVGGAGPKAATGLSAGATSISGAQTQTQTTRPRGRSRSSSLSLIARSLLGVIARDRERDAEKEERSASGDVEAKMGSGSESEKVSEVQVEEKVEERAEVDREVEDKEGLEVVEDKEKEQQKSRSVRTSESGSFYSTQTKSAPVTPDPRNRTFTPEATKPEFGEDTSSMPTPGPSSPKAQNIPISLLAPSPPPRSPFRPEMSTSSSSLSLAPPPMPLFVHRPLRNRSSVGSMNTEGSGGSGGSAGNTTTESALLKASVGRVERGVVAQAQALLSDSTSGVEEESKSLMDS